MARHKLRILGYFTYRDETHGPTDRLSESFVTVSGSHQNVCCSLTYASRCFQTECDRRYFALGHRISLFVAWQLLVLSISIYK